MLILFIMPFNPHEKNLFPILITNHHDVTTVRRHCNVKFPKKLGFVHTLNMSLLLFVVEVKMWSSNLLNFREFNC